MQLHHIGLLVDHEVYEFTKFQYKDKFGYTCVKENFIDGNSFSFLSQDGKLPYIEILSLLENALSIPSVHFAYAVKDINETFLELIDQGYIPLQYPTDASMIKKKAFLMMPTNNTYIELVVCD